MCIEIQSGNYKSRKEVKEQLMGAKCIIGYCKCIGESFWKERMFLKDYQWRFVSIVKAGCRFDKQPTRQPEQLHETPEKFQKFYGKERYFKKLIRRLSQMILHL